MIGQLNYVQQLNYALPPSQNSDFNDCVSDIFCLGTFARLSPAPLGHFSRSRLRGTQGGPPVHHGASLGPGRAPWRVLWAFQVAKSGKCNHGVAFRGARADQDNGKPIMSAVFIHCCKGQQHDNNDASSFPRSYSYSTDTTYYACAGTMPCVVMMYACIRVCRCATHASTRLCVGEDTHMTKYLRLGIFYLTGAYISVH